jgi:DNA (cytosine-5)-methyltransferase 1
MKNNTNKKLKVLDLFSGCGGLSYGFVMAGYEVLLGIDNDRASLETFEINHPGAKVANIDLFEKEFINDIKKNLQGNKPDIIVAGPPCQGFSLTGPRNFDDPRNKLYLTVLESINYFKPKAFVIENVPGLVAMYKGAVKDEIVKRCEELGYSVEARILLAANYGVPQMRRRVFFVGIRNDLGEFKFPDPLLNEASYVTTEEALSDLPSREQNLGEESDKYDINELTSYQKKMRANSEVLYNHVASVHTDRIKAVIRQVPDGGNHKHLPKGVGSHRKFNEAWTRYNSKKPSKTIDTGHRNHFHYKWDRIPTVRENARLQSFPDTFIFKGSRTAQHRQVGNAVPPLLAYAVAKEIKKAINGQN